MALAQLADWANFYVITGSAAAGLTGLTFVVIALASEAGRVNAVGLNTFITPTIVHFGTVTNQGENLGIARVDYLSPTADGNHIPRASSYAPRHRCTCPAVAGSSCGIHR